MFSIFASKAGKTRKIAKQLLEFSEKVDLYRRDVIPPADLAEQLDRAAELRAKLKEKAPRIAEYLQKRYADLISLGITVQQQLAAGVSANPRYQKGPRNFNTPQPRATLMRNGASRNRTYNSSRLMPLVFE